MEEDHFPNVPEIYKPTIQIINIHLLEINWKFDILKMYYDKNSVRLMNEFGPNFFGLVRGLLVDSIILNICNIVNSKSTEITIGKLLTISENDNLYSDRVDSLKPRIGLLSTSIKSLKTHRDKRIGHLDFSVIKQRHLGNNPLPAIRYLELNEIITDLNHFFNDFVGIFEKVEIMFHVHPSDADYLLMNQLQVLHNLNKYLKCVDFEELDWFNNILLQDMEEAS